VWQDHAGCTRLRMQVCALICHTMSQSAARSSGNACQTLGCRLPSALLEYLHKAPHTVLETL